MTGSGTDLNSLSDTPSGVPAPNPLTHLPVGSGYDFRTAAPGSRKEFGPAVSLPPAGSLQFSRGSSPAERFKQLVDTDQAGTPPAPLEETVQSQAPTRKNKPRKTDPAPETLQETLPHSISEVPRRIVLEPVSPAVYNLDYACLLVPRFPHHHMTGDLLDRMGEWVPHICVAYGWRLEYISVRPEYLQWIVNVPPATSPGNVMRILRQHTSERIFVEFPRFKKENPSGDFWAPGYLIMGGSQPPPAQLIKDYIAQTRQRQGIIQQINH